MRNLLVIAVTCLMLNGNIAFSDDLLEFSGDIRVGAFGRDRNNRDDDNSKRDELRIRARAGVKLNFNDTTSAKIRAAGRYSSDDRLNTYHFEFFESIPSDGGLRLGDSTFDELYLQHQIDKQWSVRLGRFQTKFELDGVAKKSLSRNDSDNTNITWTDGAHVKFKSDSGWDYHAIWQRSRDEGPTAVRRSPLSFMDDESHNTLYVGVEKKSKVGRFVQRGIDFTYIPESLQTEGSATGRVQDYAAASTRIAAQWPIGESGTKFLWGNEFGYAFNSPDKVAINTGGSSETSGFAFQTTFNFIDIWPSHSIGFVYARIGGGWLISGDFGNNQQLAETRYLWKINSKQKFEARIRNRRDIDKQIDALRKRREWDYYLRYTIKF